MSALAGWLHLLDPWMILVAIIDIGIVAFLIYRILLLLRGTGAVYMLLGLTAVAGIFFLAHKLSLTTLSWLLDHVISYMILIVIIVFQADIRRGLMRVGRRMLSFSEEATEEVTAIQEVVLACEELARRRIGALFVFEREAALSSFIERGVVLQAKVCRELLHNIFAPWPDNPLHDGAVVIKESWIRRVRAVLPLSMRADLGDIDRSLGTRHRAAVGITEETDAVAVVVSEQRGSISLSVRGRLHSNLTAAQLEHQLMALLALPARSRWRWLARLVRRLESSLMRERRVVEVEPPAHSPAAKPATIGEER
jgi:diadenylate cyclase